MLDISASLPKLAPFPSNYGESDGVMLSSPDGAYYKIVGDQAQIIIVGPMHFTPAQYQNALRYETDKWFWIKSAEFLPGPPNDPAKCEGVLLRGVISLIFTDEGKR